MLKVFIGLVIAAIIFVPIERLFPLHRNQKVFRKGWFNDAIHFLINKFFIQAGVLVLVIFLALMLNQIVPDSFQAAVAAQPWWLQFIEAVFVADFCAYWAHRYAHHHPFLWKLHAVHHSPRELDWLAAARLHPLDVIFRRAFLFVPIYALGFSEATFGAFAVFFAIWAIFIHCNTRLSFGPLKWIIATPRFHRWHHTRDEHALDKNFAGLLPVIDWMFGTLHLPDSMPETYGMEDDLEHHYLKQMIYPFKKEKKVS